MNTNFTPRLFRDCALTQGYELNCFEGMGGASDVWLIEFANVSGVTHASGIITAIGKANNKRFWRYKQRRGTCEAKEELQKNLEAGTSFWNQTIAMVMTKMQASIRNELVLLGQNRLVAVVKDRNGKYWYYGKEDALEMTQGLIGTGLANADRNGYGLTFTAAEKEPALEVNASVIATLETP